MDKEFVTIKREEYEGLLHETGYLPPHYCGNTSQNCLGVMYQQKIGEPKKYMWVCDVCGFIEEI